MIHSDGPNKYTPDISQIPEPLNSVVTHFLTDMTEEDEQNRLINEYHLNNNHRDINETVLHLKRSYKFPSLQIK